MSEMEDKLGAILNDPKMMQQIMSLAQTIGQNPPQEAKDPPQKESIHNSTGVNFDPAMLQKLTSLAGKTGIDQNQQSLLRALRPYLSSNRISKLEKAMRAAKMAQMAGLAIKPGR